MTGSSGPERAPLDVIVPVCGAPEALARCLDSLERHVDARLDRILIGKYSGSEIKIDNEEYVILREDEILAVIEKTEKAAKK